jgi:hypothetical protein
MSQSELNRSIPSLIKERRNSILQSRGSSEFFGVADKNEGHVLALKIILAEGDQKAIHYHDILSPMNFSGGSEITLSTTRIAIIIAGKNLDDLFDHIIQHQVKWLKEPEASFAEVSDGEVEISSIRFEMLQ